MRPEGMKRCAIFLACVLMALTVAGCGAQPEKTSATDSLETMEKEQAVPCSYVLSVSQLMFSVAEPAKVTFTVTTSVQDDNLRIADPQSGETVAELTLAGMDGEQYLYQGNTQLYREEPDALMVRAEGDLGESASVRLYFAPEITAAMLEDAYGITDWVYESVQEKYGENPDESSVEFVAELLKGDSRVTQVEIDGDTVVYATADGVSCLYALPPESGAFGAFSQDTPLTEAYENEENCAELYVYNDGCITNRDVLFLQSQRGLTTTNYHEKYCEKLADFLKGDFDSIKGTGLIRSILNGELSDYGTVVLNAHGAVLSRESGGQVGYIVACEEASENLVHELETYEAYFYHDDDASVDLLKVTTDNKGKHSVAIATDFIMALYGGTSFDNTVFMFSVCYLGQDQEFQQFLIDHGAQAVVSCPTSLMEVDDMNYFDVLADFLPEVRPDNSRSYSLGEAFTPDHFLKDHVMNIVDPDQQGKVMSLYTRNYDFVYWGKGEMQGRVMGDDAPIADADIAIYRYINHEFEVRDVTRTDEDGSFSFRNLPWGTYILEVQSGDQVTTAQINFNEKMEDCGNIYLGSAAMDDDTEDTADTAATLENYLRGTLIPQYGMMETGTWTWEGHYENLVDVSRLNGILSAALEDLDGDSNSELLLLRMESGEESSDIYLEVYEAGEEGPYAADVCYFTTQHFTYDYFETKLSLFLTGRQAGGSSIHLYVTDRMNEEWEVIRSFNYQGERLNQYFTNSYILGGDYWAYWMTQDPEKDYTYSLTTNNLAEENGWSCVDQATLDDPSYSQESIDGYKKKEQAMFNGYREALEQSGGLMRNDKGYLRTGENADSLRTADMFDNAEDFIWLAEVYGLFEAANPESAPTMRAKRFEVVDYSGLGR